MKKFQFSDSEWEITKDYYRIESIEPKRRFLSAGDICNKLGFVSSGLLRSYYYDKNGREVTLQFFQRGTVVISADSFNNRTPAEEYIAAYESSELITITHDRLLELYQKVPRWQQICKDVSDIKNTQLIDRTVKFQTLSTYERYTAFCKEYPDLILKVPLGHIASYLGMDIATLSRLRNKR